MPALQKILVGLLFFLIVPFFLSKNIFAQVVINEFLPNPIDGENEWVELYNLGSETASLSGWLLTDTANHDKPLDSLGTINLGDFVVYEYTGDGWLNNSGGETLYLKNNSGTVADSYFYSNDPGVGKSFGRSPDGTSNWIVFANPSKGANNPVPTPTPSITPTPEPNPTSTPTPKPPTPTQTPKPPTSTPTLLKLTATPSQKLQEQPTPEIGEVLGEGESSPTNQPQKEVKITNKNTFLVKVFLGLGMMALFGAAFSLWYTRLK